MTHEACMGPQSHTSLDLSHKCRTVLQEFSQIPDDTLAEVKCRPDWPHWEKAIEEELAMLKADGTWRLEEAPPRANIIGSKWVGPQGEEGCSWQHCQIKGLPCHPRLQQI